MKKKPHRQSGSDRNLAAELEADRAARAQRAATAIELICKKENVTIAVVGFALNDGRLLPQIQVIAS